MQELKREPNKTIMTVIQESDKVEVFLGGNDKITLQTMIAIIDTVTNMFSDSTGLPMIMLYNEAIEYMNE